MNTPLQQRPAEARRACTAAAAPAAAAPAVRPPALHQPQQRQQRRPPLPWPTHGSSSRNGSIKGQHLRRSPVHCSSSSFGGGGISPPRLQQSQPDTQATAGQQPAASASAAAAPSEAAPAGGEPALADVLIEFRDVWKAFGSKHILRGASFKIRRGEAVGIIGSSGTGKSTALRLAAGLLQPDKGEVLVKGEPRRGLISDDDTSDKLKVGLVFQSGALFDSLTVGENVGFLLNEHTNLPPKKVEELVAESLGKVGLSGVESLYPSELSGGMKKRVALARAIVRDEKHDNVEQVIMYDEPTAGLDPVASTVVEDLIRDLHEKHGEGHHHSHHHSHSHHEHHSHSGSSHHSSHSSSGHSRTRAGQQNGSSSGGSALGAAGANGNGNGVGALLQQVQQQAQQQCEPGGITSYVVVTHQHSTIRRAVDRIIFLHEGRVVWEGTVDEFDTTDEPIVRQFASGSLEGPIKYE